MMLHNIAWCLHSISWCYIIFQAVMVTAGLAVCNTSLPMSPSGTLISSRVSPVSSIRFRNPPSMSISWKRGEIQSSTGTGRQYQTKVFSWQYQTTLVQYLCNTSCSHASLLQPGHQPHTQGLAIYKLLSAITVAIHGVNLTVGGANLTISIT